MLKIQRSANGRVVLTLSGRIEAEDFKELGQLLALETAGQQLVLDLRDVTLVNQDTVSHRIVLDRNYAPTGFSVTLTPGQWYHSTQPLTCTGTCSIAEYTYRDANLSHVDSTAYCISFCARVTVYNNGR